MPNSRGISPSFVGAGPNLASYDWILINSSAGKDSMATLAHVVAECDAAGVDRSRIVVVHADLGRVEWAGTRELAETHAASLGLRFEVVARDEDLLDHVLTRNETLRARPGDDGKAAPWPSSQARWCTSDHKSSQVTKLMTRLVRENTGGKRGGPRVRILNCLGIRAAESIARAQKIPFGADPANWSKPPVPARRARPAKGDRPAVAAVPAVPAVPGVEHGLRHVDRWLPIFNWDEPQVWAEIIASGMPWHPAYDLGMPRLSCVICVLAPKAQLVLAARHNPDLVRVYVAVEHITGYTLKADLSMVDVAREAGIDLTSVDEIVASIRAARAVVTA